MTQGSSKVLRWVVWTMLAACLIGRAGWTPTTAEAAPEGVPCTAEPTDMTITYGDMVLCAVDAVGDTDVFRFQGSAGEKISLRVTKLSGIGNVCVDILKPDFTLLVSQCGGATIVLQDTGTYTAQVFEDGNNATVSYALTLESIVPPSPTALPLPYNQITSNEINPVGDLDLFTFQGIAGKDIIFKITTVGGSGTACAVLSNPDGTTLASLCGGGIQKHLPYTGTYVVVVFDSGFNQVVTYDLELQCLSAPCTVGDQTSAPAPPPTACFSTHTSGSGATFLKVCISDNGNVVQFESPAGAEHVRVASVGEGYAVCSTSGTHGYDVAVAEQGFGPPTITQPNGPDTLPLTIVRSTLDGAFLLTQKFVIDKTEKDVTITMNLKNTSGGTLSNVVLSRSFDGDIDHTVGSDRYARTVDSVSAWEDNTGHGLRLTASTFTIAHTTGVEPWSAWNPLTGGTAETCTAGGPTPSLPGDYVGRVTYSLGTIANNASKTVQVIYGRF